MTHLSRPRPLETWPVMGSSGVTWATVRGRGTQVIHWSWSTTRTSRPPCSPALAPSGHGPLWSVEAEGGSREALCSPHLGRPLELRGRLQAGNGSGIVSEVVDQVSSIWVATRVARGQVIRRKNATETQTVHQTPTCILPTNTQCNAK